jgi:hypothetical protein
VNLCCLCYPSMQASSCADHVDCQQSKSPITASLRSESGQAPMLPSLSAHSRWAHLRGIPADQPSMQMHAAMQR